MYVLRVPFSRCIQHRMELLHIVHIAYLWICVHNVYLRRTYWTYMHSCYIGLPRIIDIDGNVIKHNMYKQLKA